MTDGTAVTSAWVGRLWPRSRCVTLLGMAFTFVKGKQTRSVTTPADEVQARWDGFVPLSEVDRSKSDYADLQAQAKARGVNARQSKQALADAIAAYDADQSGGSDSGADVTGDSDGVTVNSDLGSPGSGEGDGSDAVDADAAADSVTP